MVSAVGKKLTAPRKVRARQRRDQANSIAAHDALMTYLQRPELHLLLPHERPSLLVVVVPRRTHASALLLLASARVLLDIALRWLPPHPAPLGRLAGRTLGIVTVVTDATAALPAGAPGFVQPPLHVDVQLVRDEVALVLDHPHNALQVAVGGFRRRAVVHRGSRRAVRRSGADGAPRDDSTTGGDR